MDEFYTPIEAVKEELEKRWNNPELKLKVNKYFGRDLPKLLEQPLRAVQVRNIMTPDGEFDRFFQSSKKFGLTPVGLEYTKDMFVAFNEDKFSVANLSFNFGRRNDGSPRVNNKKIINIPQSEGRLMSDLVTLWGEPLNSFHHRFFEESYPGFTKNIEDISDWLHYKEGGAKVYYDDLLALFIRNGVLFEGFLSSGPESPFTENVFKPAFKRVEEYFGMKPLLVMLGGDECTADPSWWYYKEEQKQIVEKLIKTYNKSC